MNIFEIHEKSCISMNIHEHFLTNMLHRMLADPVQPNLGLPLSSQILAYTSHLGISVAEGVVETPAFFVTGVVSLVAGYVWPRS